MKKLLVFLFVLIGIFIIGVDANLIKAPGFIEENRQPDVNISKLFKQDQVVKVTSEESATISAIEKTLPSVVTITFSKTQKGRSTFEIDPYNPFSPFRTREGEEQRIEENIGSGFAISDDLIVTNKHVISDGDATFTVLTNDGNVLEVVNISDDPLNDLAILKVKGGSLKAITLGDSSKLKLGQTVIAIGTPLGEFTNTVTSGIISGLGRGITAGSPFEGFVERLDNVIQTDAAINPGNSGGPLINLEGEVIGVNTAVSQSSENIGFAIPVDVVRDLVDNYNHSGGKIQRPYLGIRYQMITEETITDANDEVGALVIDVIEGSPADIAGVKQNDVIVELEGTDLTKNTTQTSVQKIIAKKNVGDKVALKVLREGKTAEITATLKAFE